MDTCSKRAGRKQEGKGGVMYSRRWVWVVLTGGACLVAGCNLQVREADIGVDGGAITVGDATLTIPPGALAMNHLIRLSVDNNASPELEVNETPVSDVFRVVQDAEDLIDALNAPFSMDIPFDLAATGVIVTDAAVLTSK